MTVEIVYYGNAHGSFHLDILCYWGQDSYRIMEI